MGNGDRKSRKGKIRLGSFGVRRLRKKHKRPQIKATGKATEVNTKSKPEVFVKMKEEKPIMDTVTTQEVAIEVKEKVEITAETKTETKPKEKATPKAKEKKEVKTAPKAKKTKKEE